MSKESSAAASGQMSELMESFLGRVVTRGERSVSLLRGVLCGLVFVRLVLFGGLPGLSQGEPKFVIVTVGLVFGVAASAWFFRALGRREATRRDLVLSVAVDAVTIGLSLVPGVIWPADDSIGVLRNPDIAILLLGVIGGGARLSRTVALFGAGLYLGLGVLMVGIDLRLNAALIGYDADEYAIWGVYFIGATALAVVTAVRTQALLVEAAEATRRSERVRQRLGAYVSEVLAAEVLSEPGGRLGGRRQQVAVLFSDLRGFTRYSSRLSPEALVDELNDYLSAMVEAIEAEGGVVDKYMGDGIMVVFGVPSGRPDDAARAIRAAEGMQEALAAHNVRRRAQGLEALQQGIGVHYGAAVAGNIGTKERLQYTVLGDSVNLASRLEASTKLCGVAVLISSEAVEAARASGERLPQLEPLGPIELRGLESPVEVFALGERAPDGWTPGQEAG